MYVEDEANFEGILRKTGNSYVITVPKEVITKLNLGENVGMSIHVKKWKKT
jgi:antitoxin component of MazEF toxin-antitoxin module